LGLPIWGSTGISHIPFRAFSRGDRIDNLVGDLDVSESEPIQWLTDCVPRGTSEQGSKRVQIMTNRQIKLPGPDHPISIENNPSRVAVTVGGKVIADTRNALILREASYPAVQYVPRRDVNMAALTRTQHTTFCPYKGEAAYFSIPAGGDRSANAVWTYETPFEAMAQIKEYVAFYPDRVDEIRVTDAGAPGFSGLIGYLP
jgi:uncharacterized protein (DUF427 family)